MSGPFPEELRYTKEDEWVRREGEEAVYGVTSYASEQLGDVVYVQLPSLGTTHAQGDSMGEIESVKAVSDLYCPVGGTVTAVNQELDQNPGLVNEDPYGRGWMVRLKMDNLQQFDALLDAHAYEQNTLERH